MTRTDQFIAQLESYLESYEGSTPLPDDVRDAIRAELPSIHQRPAWWPARRLPTMNNSMKLALATAAVAVAAFVGYSYLVAPNVGGPDITRPTPTPQPGASLEAGLPVLDEQEGPLEPGTYVVTDVEPLRIGITVPAGWTKNVLDAAVWTESSTVHIWFGRVDNIYADPCAASEGLLDPPVGPTADDLADAVAALPGVNAVATEVSFSGYPGTYLELTPADPIDGWCGGDAALWDLPDGEVMGGPDSFGQVRLWIVDVSGDRLVMIGQVRAAASSTETGGLQEIVESIQIQAP
jgi:hypothetical protein